MVKISSKLEVFNFSGGRSSLLGGLTIIERSWNYGNLPYLVANTYRLYFIKLRGIWIFRGGGQKPPIRGLHVTCNAHFRTWLSYSSQKSCVKIWLGLVEPFKSYRVHKHFSGRGQKPPIRGGYVWRVMPIFELRWAIPVRSHVLKFGLDWLKSKVC